MIQLRQCRACAARGANYQQCAFLTGVFDPGNWACASLAALALRAGRHEGDELECLLVDDVAGGVLVLVRRVGVPQRVRLAWRVSPRLQREPLTLEAVERVLYGREAVA